MIEREQYLKKLRLYKDKDLIKVVSGVRRCGKSTILKMFAEELLQSGVKQDQIIQINFENMAYHDLLDHVRLYEYLKNKILNDKKTYIFLDEVQSVTDFEKVVDSVYIQKNTDVYITGSNAKFLSKDLATILTGRYIEIKMLPLSFKEFTYAFEDKSNILRIYDNYINYGSFPYAVELFKDDPSGVRDYLQNIYQTIIYKDIVAREKIKNTLILEDVIKYMFDNIGNITNPKKISDYLTANYRKVSNHTVEKYLKSLSDGFILYPVNRYDLKGKKILQSNKKYYCVDMTFRNLFSDSAKVDYGKVLENIVFLELLRRYEKIWIGKNKDYEIDFVVKKKGGALAYYQVSLTVRDEKTLKRELRAFDNLDNYEKFLITLDTETNNHNGIIQVNVIDWLLDNKI
jgi:predicted AAA+ superfamily ATPase